MRLLTLPTLLICTLFLNAPLKAQSTAEPVNAELYQLLNHYYTVASVESEIPVLAFFKAAFKTFYLGSDTTRRIFNQLQQAHQEMDDSAIIDLMLTPVINHFLDNAYLPSVCPASAERAEEGLQAYRNYMCGCIPREQLNIARYDSAAVLYEAIASCKRTIRFNDSLNKQLMGRLLESGMPAAAIDRCADAYTFTHCVHLRTIITDLCSKMVLDGYRAGKTQTLYYLADLAEYCLNKGDAKLMTGKLFDNDSAAEEMNAAAYWAKPELMSYNIQRYTEVHNYGHELVMTFLIDEARPVFILQVTFALKWKGGICQIAGVHLTKPRYIQDKDKILAGARDIKQKIIAARARQH